MGLQHLKIQKRSLVPVGNCFAELQQEKTVTKCKKKTRKKKKERGEELHTEAEAISSQQKARGNPQLLAVSLPLHPHEVTMLLSLFQQFKREQSTDREKRKIPVLTAHYTTEGHFAHSS